VSSKDKTRNKLVGSMRKTKAEAGIGADTPAPRKAAPPRPAAKPAASPATASDQGAAPARAAAPNADNYQSGRRVWPD